MSKEAENFVSHLLQKDPRHRLGSKGGLAEILAHPWFSDLSADQLISKQIKPDFKPKLSKNILDVSNFDKEFTSEESKHSVIPYSAQRKIARARDKFKEFDC